MCVCVCELWGLLIRQTLEAGVPIFNLSMSFSQLLRAAAFEDEEEEHVPKAPVQYRVRPRSKQRTEEQRQRLVSKTLNKLFKQQFTKRGNLRKPLEERRNMNYMKISRVQHAPAAHGARCRKRRGTCDGVDAGGTGRPDRADADGAGHRSRDGVDAGGTGHPDCDDACGAARPACDGGDEGHDDTASRGQATDYHSFISVKIKELKADAPRTDAASNRNYFRVAVAEWHADCLSRGVTSRAPKKKKQCKTDVQGQQTMNASNGDARRQALARNRKLRWREAESEVKSDANA